MCSKKDLQDYLNKPCTDSDLVPGTVRPIRLYDDMSLSVQASAHHYCTPKKDGAQYTSVEVGISHDDYFILQDDLKDWDFRLVAKDYWIAGWVSIDKVADFISEYGNGDAQCGRF